MQESSKNYSRGYLIGISATTLWSFTGILISYLGRTYALPSLVLAVWRDLFVSFGLVVAFIFITPARFRIGRQHLPFMILFGLVLAFFNSMWTFSVQFNGAAVATVLAIAVGEFPALQLPVRHLQPPVG